MDLVGQHQGSMKAGFRDIETALKQPLVQLLDVKQLDLEIKPSAIDQLME